MFPKQKTNKKCCILHIEYTVVTGTTKITAFYFLLKWIFSGSTITTIVHTQLFLPGYDKTADTVIDPFSRNHRVSRVSEANHGTDQLYHAV